MRIPPWAIAARKMQRWAESLLPDAIRGRSVKEGAAKAGRGKAGKHRHPPDEILRAVHKHPRYQRPGQWSSVTNEVGGGLNPTLSGKQVRRILDEHHPETKW